jgi:hypothetical protein
MRPLFLSLGEKALGNFGAFFLVAFRSSPKKCIADLRHAATFPKRCNMELTGKFLPPS